MIPELRADIALDYAEQPSKTWRLDLKNNRIGNYIDGLDAVAQAAYLAIQARRYKNIIHSWQYGSELYTLIGKDPDYIYSEGKRMITEALSTDTRITDVRDFSFDNQVISFTIDTIFGSKRLETEVSDTDDL